MMILYYIYTLRGDFAEKSKPHQDAGLQKGGRNTIKKRGVQQVNTLRDQNPKKC